MIRPSYARSRLQRRFYLGEFGPQATTVLTVLVLTLPVGLLAAMVPGRYALMLVGVVALPVVVVLGARMPLGVLLSFALVAPSLVQFVVQGSPFGIPVAAVLPIVGADLILLVRGLPLQGRSPRLAPVELIFLAAIFYAAVVGLSGDSDRRVWLGELTATSNLMVMLWLFRLNRVRFTDLHLLVVVGHIVAFPFFAWYLLTRFGQYRLDFFFGLSSTLVPMTIAVLLNTRAGLLQRGLLLASCFLMLLATAAAGIRGTTMVALLGSGLMVAFSLRRLSGATLLVTTTAVFTLVLFQPLLIGFAAQMAPEAVDRFRTAADSPTLSVRLLEAQDAFTAFKESPTGRGLGAILVTRHEIIWGDTGISIEYGPATYVHNSYAWYLAKTGVIGFAALMLMLGSAVFAAIRRLPTKRGSAGLSLALLLSLLIGAWGGPALHGVFYTPLLALTIYLAREAGGPESVPLAGEAVSAPLAGRPASKFARPSGR